MHQQHRFSPLFVPPVVGNEQVLELKAIPFPFRSLAITRHLRSLFNSARDWSRGKTNEDFASVETANEFLRSTEDALGDLSIEGKLQGARMQASLRDAFNRGAIQPPQMIVVSPFLRAERTSRFIADACLEAPRIRTDPRIREFGVEQTALTTADLAGENPDRETVESLDLRTFNFLKELAADPELAGKDVWLVTHGHWALRLVEKLSKTQVDGTPLKSFPNGAILELTPDHESQFASVNLQPYNFVAAGFGGDFWNRVP